MVYRFSTIDYEDQLQKKKKIEKMMDDKLVPGETNEAWSRMERIFSPPSDRVFTSFSGFSLAMGGRGEEEEAACAPSGVLGV